MATESNNLKWALWYAEKLGMSVIPIIPGDKSSMVPWKKYQNERAGREQIIAWWTKEPLANVGIVTGAISDLDVIDIDSDEGRRNIEQYIPDSFLTPMVDTPRGGEHYWCTHSPGLTNKAGLIAGTDFRGEGGYVVVPPSANGNGKHYTWRKGCGIGDVIRSALPIAYINKIKNSSIKENVTQSDTMLQELQQVTISLDKGTRNDSLFHIANSLFKGGMSKENVIYTCENIAKSCNPPLLLSEVLTIVDSAFTRKLGRQRNIQQEIESWVRVTTGDFHVTSSYTELQIVTKEDKTAARQAYKRLVTAEIIEKIGNRDGMYRLKQNELEEIDYMNADTTPFNVRWPLDIHEFVKIYKKSIVIIAGESNAGKTAYCLNIAKRNRKEHEILYLLSEGDAAELKVRLMNFNEPLESWKPVKFKRIKGGNLSKMIRPDGFNIIDYLEIYKDFYEVAGAINEIYETLTTGLAIIAMQKPMGRDLGVGGRGTLDKARLYLSIEPGIIKIVKGKVWANECINPNRMFVRWKLGGGCHFKQEGNWCKE